MVVTCRVTGVCAGFRLTGVPARHWFVAFNYLLCVARARVLMPVFFARDFLFVCMPSRCRCALDVPVARRAECERCGACAWFGL